MPGDKTRDLRKVNRRSFLRKLSAMGISGAALQYMTKDALAGRVNGGLDKVGDEYFFASVNSVDGDSGGPYFEIVGGDSYIAGIHKGSWEDGDGDSGTTASGMVHIEDHFNITV